jgi:hypothetical protein
MTTDLDDLLPKAEDCRKKMAEAEAEKAADYLRQQAKAEAEKKALLDQLAKPSGVSDDERMKRAAVIIMTMYWPAHSLPLPASTSLILMT